MCGHSRDEVVGDGVRAPGRVRGDAHVEVDAVARREFEAVGGDRARRVRPVDREQPGGEPAEAQAEHPPVGRVEDANAQPRPWAREEAAVRAPVDGNVAAPPAVVREVVARVERGVDGALGVEPPVVEHPDDLLVEGERGVLVLDDEHAVQAALHLLAAAHMRVETRRRTTSFGTNS